MRITLVGMSGSGKSFWSAMLAEEGFRRYCCDDLIAQKLSNELGEIEGSQTDLGKWMGFPYDPGYEERESMYLACEVEVLQEVLDMLSSRRRVSGEKVVVDSTGSVIHGGAEILSGLRKQTTVVHLATPPEVRRVMLENYMSKPRPVLWRGRFHRKPGESNGEALARCYPELLVYRERLYEELAHVTVPYEQHHGKRHGVGEFLQRVCQMVDCS